jgi:hypothetical protein
MMCNKCQVASTCPRRGSSPLTLPNQVAMQCRLLGGYGRKPVDLSDLSEESKKIATENGTCLTVAEVPTLDEASGKVYYETIKIFSKPILHPREKVGPRFEMMYPKSYGGKHPK